MQNHYLLIDSPLSSVCMDFPVPPWLAMFKSAWVSESFGVSATLAPQASQGQTCILFLSESSSYLFLSLPLSKRFRFLLLYYWLSLLSFVLLDTILVTELTSARFLFCSGSDGRTEPSQHRLYVGTILWAAPGSAPVWLSRPIVMVDHDTIKEATYIAYKRRTVERFTEV
jgi:hypothetical protein